MSDIVKAPSTGLTLGASFSNVTLKPAFMEMVQRTTRDANKQPGKFVDMLTMKHFDAIEVILFQYTTNRPGYYDKDQPMGSRPLCYSLDGIKPAERAQFPQAVTCAQCDLGKWKGQRIPPDCPEGKRMVFLEADSGLPYIMTLKGKSVSPMNKMYDAIQRYAIEAAMKGNTREMYDYVFTLTPTLTQDQKGTYYVARPSNLRLVEDSSKYGALYNLLIAKAQEAEEEAAAEAAEAAVNEEMAEPEV